MKYIDGGVCAPNGFLAWGVHCGVRKNISKNDLALIYSEAECASAGLYTKNSVKAAPVIVDMETGRSGRCRAIAANSGIANACAPDGIKNARLMQQYAAEVLGLQRDEVLIGSTGIIGQVLPIDVIKEGLKAAKKELTHDAAGSGEAAEAILTTDTRKKELACELEIGGKTVTIGGISKGSGMIHPNMGTMLCYLTTDLAVEPETLKAALKEVCDVTFNRISIDGDMSTNDSLIILANGMAGNPLITGECEDLEIFKAALKDICTELARKMARDGEGAKHLLTCTVRGAADDADAEAIAKSVISSTLTKCAIFANDANWGRVLCAMGYSEADIDPNKADVVFRSAAGEVKVCEAGHGVDFDESFATEILSRDEVIIDILAGDGCGEATCWGCDMTYDYVEINGSYRS